MASRLTHKPDPAIKKHILRTRATARKASRAHAMAVGISLGATIFTWGLFNHQDTQALEAAQVATSNQAALVITTPTPENTVASAVTPEVAAQLPAALTSTRSSR